MPYTVDKSIRFDGPPTLDEAIAALEELRRDTAGSALLRVRGGKSAFNKNGPYPSRFTAEKQGS